MTPQGRVEPVAPAGTGHWPRGIAQRARGGLLSIAVLPHRLGPAVVLKVGLLTVTVRTCADGDRLLTLHCCRSSSPGN